MIIKSDDGKIFETVEECSKYEAELKKKHEEELLKKVQQQKEQEASYKELKKKYDSYQKAYSEYLKAETDYYNNYGRKVSFRSLNDDFLKFFI